MHTISERKLLMLRPCDISVLSDSHGSRFDEYSLHMLASSILSNGMLEPLSVRREGRDKYILISGERRLKSAKIAGLRRVPCVVHEVSETEAAICSLALNINRENLDFFEQAKAINRLIGAYCIPVSDISQRLGMSGSAISGKLNLLKIPEDKRKRILAAGLTEAHAGAIAGLDKNNMALVLDAVISESLSVKQTKELILSVTAPRKEEALPPAPPVRKSAIGDMKLFSNSLTKLLITMQNSGIRTSLDRKETESFTEYTVRIENCKEKQLSFLGI